MALKQITEDNYFSLLRSLDPSPDLLGRVRSVAFVKDKISSVEQQLTNNLKNNALLNALLEVPNDTVEEVMNGFISALRSSGQDHVANIFRRESDKVVMSEEHYRLLSTKQFDLCKFMNPRDGLIHYLVSLEVFSETDKEKILSKTSLDDMAKETVNTLLRKSDCAFDKFVSALNETNQSHVSYLLTRVGNPPMSDEHRRTLNAKMHDLANYTDTENGLLDRLISHDVITLHDSEHIRSVNDQNAMARKLVEVLIRKSDDAFHQLITLLRETGQTHVAYILTGEGSSRPLKEEHRRRLLSSPREYLVKTIDSKNSGLVTALMDNGVFSCYDEQRVTSVRPDTQDDRNEMILNLIARKSQSDFFKFISALNNTDQTHIVVALIGVNVVAKIKTIYESGTDGGRVSEVDAELLEYMRELFRRNGEVVRRLSEILSQNGITVFDVEEGCIAITFTCSNSEALNNFQDLYDSGQLEDMLSEAFSSPFAQNGPKSLKVVIFNEQFEQCAQTFARWIPMTAEHREALLSSKKWLFDKMAVNDDLLDRLTLCRRRKQATESASTREQQVKTLLDIVSRQPDAAFTQLLKALYDTQQTEAADIISGHNNRTATKSEPRETKETHTADVWKEVDQNLECLLTSIADNYSDEGFPSMTPVFRLILCALHDVILSLRSLREQYSVPTSRPSIDEELEHLLCELVSSTQSQMSLSLSEDSQLDTGELLFF